MRIYNLRNGDLSIKDPLQGKQLGQETLSK